MNPIPVCLPGMAPTWIGGDDNDLVLYAKYLPVFNVNYKLAIAPGSSRAAR
jgi:alpha-L-rhamnosidase